MIAHNKEIRMLFKAGNRQRNVEISNNNSYIIHKTDEVYTLNGWTPVLDIEIGDKIEASDDTIETVINIIDLENCIELVVA